MEKKKKYKIIVKVNNDKFVKYNVNNLLLFTQFLDKNFSGWRWFNVYNMDKEQIGSFTTKKRPTSSKIG
jgi:hypothetical protein